MKNGRGVYHPLLLNKRSRFILFSFLALSLLFGHVLFGTLNEFIALAEIDPATLKNSGPLSFLFIPAIQYGLMIVLGVAVAGWTASKVVGPSERLEKFIHDRENNSQTPYEMKVRKKDNMSHLTRLINEL